MNAWWLRLTAMVTTAVVAAAFVFFVYFPSMKEIEEARASTRSTEAEAAAIIAGMEGQHLVLEARDTAASAAASLEQQLGQPYSTIEKEIRASTAGTTARIVTLSAGAPSRSRKGVCETRDVVFEAQGPFTDLLTIIARLEAVGDHVHVSRSRLHRGEVEEPASKE
ncbi:MAG: hypothetical protein ACYTFT_11675, partial [Planctomycetota bacterium]